MAAIFPAASTYETSRTALSPGSKPQRRYVRSIRRRLSPSGGIHRHLAALTLTACRSHDFPQYPPNYREYAYVTNGGSGTVTVLDVVNVRIDRELAVGQNPVAVAASPTRNEVYVVNSGVAGRPGLRLRHQR